MDPRDEFDFPAPAGFDDVHQRTRPGSSGGRLKAVFLVLLFAGLIAAVVQVGREIQERHPGLLGRLGNDLLGRSPQTVARRLLRNIKQKRYDAALRDADQLVRLAPDQPLAHLLRGDVLGQLGRYQESIAEYGRVLEMVPNEPMALNNRAYNRALARIELDEALADVEQALRIAGENSAFLDTRGYLHYLLGRPRDALADLNRAVELAEEDAGPDEGLGEIYFHRALVHDVLAEQELADQDLQAARSLGFEFDWNRRPLPMRQP